MNLPAGDAPLAVVAVRPLQADDIGRCVSIHLEAFPNFFLSELGPRFLHEFYRAFLEDDSAVAFVAESGETQIGAVVGTVGPRGFFRRLLVRRWWAFGLASLPLLLDRPSALVRVARAILYRGGDNQPGAALLSSICVQPAFAGSGVGRRLLAAWCEAARTRGASQARLETDAAGNEGANKFYVAQGWELREVLTTHEGRQMNTYVTDLAGGGAVSDGPGATHR